jgi:hypothetical protein
MSQHYIEQMSRLTLLFPQEIEEIENYTRCVSPGINLALACGLVDASYPTWRGLMYCYRGEATIHMADGSTWIARGLGSGGTPEHGFTRGVKYERVS